jgi:hypothetical protein
MKFGGLISRFSIAVRSSEERLISFSGLPIRFSFRVCSICSTAS